MIKSVYVILINVSEEVFAKIKNAHVLKDMEVNFVNKPYVLIIVL